MELVGVIRFAILSMAFALVCLLYLTWQQARKIEKMEKKINGQESGEPVPE